MKKIRKIISLVLYYGCAYYLPSSLTPVVGGMCRRFRWWLCKGIFLSVGKWNNIERRVYFGNNEVSLGENSGLGENFRLQNSSFYVGNNVMIARDLHVVGGGIFSLINL